MAAAAAATSLLIRHNRNPHLLLLRAAISSSRALSQQPELSPDPTTGAPDPAGAAPLPPNPSTGSPLYSQNWRNPAAANPPSSLLPTVAAGSSFGAQHRMAAFYDKPDAAGLKETFAKYMAEQRWEDMKLLFDHWVRSLDAATGKPNHPDVDLFNHYLRANLMTGAVPHEMLDLADHMREFELEPNSASYNLVLKSMVADKESYGAEKLIERMLQTGTVPDEESYNLVVGLLIRQNLVDSSLKYLDLMLKSGYTPSLTVFTDYIQACVRSGRLDTLTSIIQKCKTADKIKVLCPQWAWCIDISEAAFEANNSKLALFALEFLARWIVRVPAPEKGTHPRDISCQDLCSFINWPASKGFWYIA
uniref:Pentatricopeptide repeat-containing protein n=1 Tax=Zea mays TaxID=4577 RepID=A0A804UES8_MAIZE